ncbi:MAG: hypothetical protein Q4F44_05160, partial [Bacteroidales bacterium]|nr:hypothetical protein [Bacteroidales bacterium]
DFHANLWSTKTVAEIRQDSIDAANAAAKDSIEGNADGEKKVKKRKAGKKEGEEKVSRKKKEKKSQGSTSKAARVSVRRTRR